MSEELIQKYVIGELTLPQLLTITGLYVAFEVLKWGAKALLDHFKHTRKPNNHDHIVWLKIQEIFSSGLISYFRDLDMGNPIPHTRISPIHEFVEKMSNGENRFISNILEKARAKLVQAADSFSEHMATYLHPLSTNSEIFKAAPDSNYTDEIRERIRALNVMARELVSCFEELQTAAIKTFNKKIS